MEATVAQITAQLETNRLAQATAKRQLRKERERERHLHGEYVAHGSDF